MNILLNVNSLFLIKTDILCYILAVIFFCAFVVVLLWYLLAQKKDNNKQTKSWTIESARKFLESNNIDIKELSNEKAVSNQKSTTANNVAVKTSSTQASSKVSNEKNSAKTTTTTKSVKNPTTKK